MAGKEGDMPYTQEYEDRTAWGNSKYPLKDALTTFWVSSEPITPEDWKDIYDRERKPYPAWLSGEVNGSMIRIFAIDRKTKEEHEITDNLWYFEEASIMSFESSDEDFRLEITIGEVTEIYYIEEGGKVRK